MGDSHYPSVDTEFIIENLKKSSKIDNTTQRVIGSTISFMINGNQALHKRMIIIRENNGQINFEQASSLAIRFSFMGELLKWLESNRNYKEGGYTC